MTPHISSKKEDIAKTVLIAGDPKRTEFIAKTYLENPVLVNEDEMANAPENFDTKKAIGKGFEGLQYRMQVSPMDCTGCGNCADICPAKAIEMKNKKPVINKKVCIRCFCCQEFCPVGAMKTHRTLISRIITKKLA